MKKGKGLFWVFSIFGMIAAVTAALTAYFVVKDKREKEEAELEEYLDSSII